MSAALLIYGFITGALTGGLLVTWRAAWLVSKGRMTVTDRQD